MRFETIRSQVAHEPWQADVMPTSDERSAHVTRIIALANTLAAAETAVLTGERSPKRWRISGGCMLTLWRCSRSSNALAPTRIRRRRPRHDETRGGFAACVIV